jgi:hypothetical protein
MTGVYPMAPDDPDPRCPWWAFLPLAAGLAAIAAAVLVALRLAPPAAFVP